MKLSTRVAIKLRLLIPKFHFPRQLSEFFLDHIKPHVYFDRWSIQPFNGQAIRFMDIASIAKTFSPNIGIETGTFLGSSTPYLASMVSEQMHTIEIDPKTFRLAQERFHYNHANTKIVSHLGDSVQEINKLLSVLPVANTRILAYLDAHWYDAVPTTDELNALLDWGGSWIAVIDDFKVPTDSDYKYDVYGILEIGEKVLPTQRNLCLYVPRTPASKETGRRKGTGYVCRKEDEKFLSVCPDLVKIL